MLIMDTHLAKQLQFPSPLTIISSCVTGEGRSFADLRALTHSGHLSVPEFAIRTQDVVTSVTW